MVHFDSAKLKDVSSKLYLSCQRIAVHIMPAMTGQDVALVNAELSMRGSLRKAWNVVTWMVTILRLKKMATMTTLTWSNVGTSSVVTMNTKLREQDIFV